MKLKRKDWRVNHLYCIIDKDQKKVGFTMNRAQEHFNINKSLRNIILKSRQHGFTTLEAVDMLDDCLFTTNFRGLFVAHTKDVASEIFDQKVKYAWYNIPNSIRSLVVVDNSTAQKLKFDFGDQTYSTFIVSNSGRSGTNNRVHISEYAKLCKMYPQKADEIISGTIPSVPLDGRIDIEGTAEGVGGHFYSMFWEAWKRGEPQHPTQFKAHFYNWTWDDAEIAKVTRSIPFNEMDEGQRFKDYAQLHDLTDIQITYYYYKWLSLNRDWDMLNQEYPTTPEEAFVASGTPYFNTRKITEYIAHAPEPLYRGNIYLKADKSFDLDLSDDIGELKMWEKPDQFTRYTIGGDTAEGIEGGDYQVLEVINNKTLKTDAKISSRMPPNDLARTAYALGKYFNWALIGIEANKDGLWVNTELFDMRYPNLYFREELDDITKRVTKRVGFKTDMTTRPVVLAELKRMVNERSDIWNNKDFLHECLTFSRNKMGKPEALLGEHDDEVMATAIAYYIRSLSPISLPEPILPDNSAAGMVQARLARLKKHSSIGKSQMNYY